MSVFSTIFGKADSVVGIDIGTSSVKMVQIKKEKGAAVLETYGSLAIGPYMQKEIGQTTKPSVEVLQNIVQVLMKEAKITSKNVGMAIPFSASLLSIIDIPSVSEARIASIVPYEARKYIPVPIDQVSLDWFVIPDAFFESKEDDPFEPPKTDNINRTKKVLLIAVYNKNLTQYRDTAQALKLNVNFFELEIFGTLRALLDTNRYPVFIIDIGGLTTKFYIVEHGIVLRSYFINQGGETVTKTIQNTLNVSFKEAEGYKREEGLYFKDSSVRDSIGLVLDEIMRESLRAISDFEGRYHKTIGRIIFTGGGALLKGLDVHAKKSFSAQVQIADPFSQVKHPAFLSEMLRDSGPEFSVAIGLALRALYKKR